MTSVCYRSYECHSQYSLVSRDIDFTPRQKLHWMLQRIQTIDPESTFIVLFVPFITRGVYVLNKPPYHFYYYSTLCLAQFWESCARPLHFSPTRKAIDFAVTRWLKSASWRWHGDLSQDYSLTFTALLRGRESMNNEMWHSPYKLCIERPWLLTHNYNIKDWWGTFM